MKTASQAEVVVLQITEISVSPGGERYMDDVQKLLAQWGFLYQVKKGEPGMPADPKNRKDEVLPTQDTLILKLSDHQRVVLCEYTLTNGLMSHFSIYMTHSLKYRPIETGRSYHVSPPDETGNIQIVGIGDTVGGWNLYGKPCSEMLLIYHEESKEKVEIEVHETEHDVKTLVALLDAEDSSPQEIGKMVRDLLPKYGGLKGLAKAVDFPLAALKPYVAMGDLHPDLESLVGCSEEGVRLDCVGPLTRVSRGEQIAVWEKALSMKGSTKKKLCNIIISLTPPKNIQQGGQ